MKIFLYSTIILILVLKYKFQSVAELDTAWNLFYTNGEYLVTPKGIEIDSTNNIYVLLCLNDKDNNLSNHILKFDKDGNKIWMKQILNGLDEASAFIIINDKIYLVGTTSSNIGTSTNKGGKDIFFGWLDLNAEFKFGMSYGSDKDDIPKFISNDANFIYILGETYGSIDDMLNKGGKDIFLTQINVDTLKIIWTDLQGDITDDFAISLASRANKIFVIVNISNKEKIICYDSVKAISMNTVFIYPMKIVIFDIIKNPNLIAINGNKIILIYASQTMISQGGNPYYNIVNDKNYVQSMYHKINNYNYMLNTFNYDGIFKVSLHVIRPFGIQSKNIIGSNYDNMGLFFIFDSDYNVYILGTSSTKDSKNNVFMTKLCNYSCQKTTYQICSVECSSNDEICFSNRCVKKVPFFDPPAPVPPAPVPPAPVPPAPVPPAPVTNKKENVFDLITSSAKPEEFINHIEIVNLYSADSFDTTSITLNTDYRAVTINLKLYVFSKETTSPNDSSVTINLKINDEEVEFEKNYDIITYPKLEPFINSNDINFSILSLNHVYLHHEKINTLSLKITNSDPNKYKVYATLIQLNASICHSRCKECDQNTFNCLSCYDAIYSSSNNCQCPQDKPSATYEDNYENVICNTSVEADLCQKYSLNSNGFTTCLECKGSTFKTYDDFINPLCKCKSGFIWTGKDDMSKECYSYLEDTCSDYDSTSLNIKAINTWLTTKDNIQMKISDEVEPIYDEVYFNLQLSPKPFPTEASLNIGKDIAFKISILKGSDDVSNILYLSKWSNNLSDGININKNDLQKGLYDCETKTISNNSKVYTCKISIYAFNPCKSFIYMNTIAKVKIGDGGVIESEISIDANGQSNINIPCLNNNTCFFNEKFSNTIMICEKLPCLQTRSSPFAPGDVLNIKPTLSVTDGNPDKYTQSIETAAFIIKNSKGEETGKFDVSQDFKLTTENGKKIFGFIIPAAGSLMTKSGYLEGANVSFNIIFKVDESLRRILQTDAQNGYSLIPPLNIKIEIDPEYLQGGSKYEDLISENRINTLIIIFSCIVSSLLVGIILYCYIKNRLNNKINNNIVYGKANIQSDKYYSNGSDKNEMNENNNIEDIDVKI